MVEKHRSAIRSHPWKWLGGVVALVIEKLLEHRALAWANEPLDRGAGPAIFYLAAGLRYSVAHPVVSAFDIIGAYSFGVILYAYFPVLSEFVFRKKNLPVLEFFTWHGGSSRSLPVIALGVPSWIAVKNASGLAPIFDTSS